MIADLTAFSEGSFNAKDWVNDACKDQPSEDSVEKYLAEVEMKLQLLAEDIGASLEEHSAQALRRIPKAVHEIMHVKDGALGLRGSLGGTLQRLQTVEMESAESVSVLSSIEQVKTRMVDARNTLKEAAGLAELMASVDEVFASGKLDLMASTVASMRRALAAVGDVPEFAGGMDRLEALEDRLESMVEGPLEEAFAQRQAETVQELRDTLTAISRPDTLERAYLSCREAQLKAKWDQYRPGTALTEFLPSFYDELLTLVEGENRWCAAVLPAEHPQLLLRFLADLFSKLRPSFDDRLAPVASGPMWMSKAKALEPHPPPLQGLIHLMISASTCGRNLQHTLAAAPQDEVRGILAGLYGPFEAYVAKYGDLEREQLARDLDALDLGEGGELDGVARAMAASIPAVVALMEEAVERCLGFTGGTEAEALIKALDDTVAGYAGRLHNLLGQFRDAVGLGAGGKAGGKGVGGGKAAVAGGGEGGGGEGEEEDDDDEEEEEEEEEEGGANSQAEQIGVALQLLGVCSALTSRAGVLEASLRATLTDLSASLATPLAAAAVGGAGAGADKADAVALRLAAAPDRARRLVALLEQAADSRFRALPHAAPKVAAFQGAVEALVYDVLMLKVHEHLGGVEALPEWTEEDEARGSAFELPTFSAYPLAYVTALGEYLLTLPQQLEPLGGGGGDGEEGAAAAGPGGMVGGDEEDEDYFASEWTGRVAAGAGKEMVSKVLGVARLSPKGAGQLAADLDYFCNILAALTVALPPSLATLQACVRAPENEMALVVHEMADSCDMAVVDAVARMRGVNLK